MPRKTPKQRAREYAARARGPIPHIPKLTPEQKEAANIEAARVIGEWRDRHEQSDDLRVAEPFTEAVESRAKLYDIETGRVVLGGALLSEDELQEVVDRHPSKYAIKPPQNQQPDV